jgi:Coenzyme PQQ synthesis protein D (PqqD)
VTGAEVYAPNPRVRLRRRAGDRALLLGLGPDVCELDQAGAEIWAGLDGHRSVAELAGAIAAEYGADPGEVGTDVGALLAELAAGGFVVAATGRG